MQLTGPLLEIAAGFVTLWLLAFEKSKASAAGTSSLPMKFALMPSLLLPLHHDPALASLPTSRP